MLEIVWKICVKCATQNLQATPLALFGHRPCLVRPQAFNNPEASVCVGFDCLFTAGNAWDDAIGFVKAVTFC